MEKLKELYKTNKKAFFLGVIGIVAVLSLLIGATYAYYSVSVGNSATNTVRLTTDTTDNLTFTLNKDINITASKDDFYLNAGDKVDSITGIVTLIPNSGTGQASENYNLFMIIDTNEFVYTTQSELPEIALKVTDPEGNVVERLQDLNGTDGVFDITTKRGSVAIATDYAINSIGNTATTQEWTVEIRFINLDTEQTLNEGKRFHGTLYLTKESINNYELPEINSVLTSNGGSSNITENSITLGLNISDTTRDIDKYYYAIEESNNTTSYIESGIVKLGSIKKNYDVERLSVTDSDYVEVTTNTHTFNNLSANTNYNVYTYITDTNGYKSNIYKTTLKTTTDVLPSISGLEIETNINSISVSVTAVAGTNAISKYYYSKDNGVTWIEGDSNTYTFSNLSNTRGYDIKVKAVDENNLESSVYYEKVNTNTYINPDIKNVEVTTTDSTIALNVIGEKGTSNIDKYLYSIDGTTWVEGTNSKTYTTLDSNQEYQILIKAEDVNGNNSSTYKVIATTNSYTLPKVSNVQINVQPTSMTINVTGVNGTNAISKYYYSIHDGRGYVESSESSKTFDNLTTNSIFYVKVYVEDSNGEKSPVFSKVVKTEYTLVNINNVQTTIGTDNATLIINATDGTNTIAAYEYKTLASDTWIDNGSSNTISITNLNESTNYTYKIRVKDSGNYYSKERVITFTTKESDIRIAISDLPTTYGKVGSLNCSSGTATYNQKYERIEIGNGKANCSLSFDNPTNTTPLNQYIISLNNKTQGDGKVVFENGYRYEGKNPNNYVWFNNELWRIIGVFDSTSHGQSGKNLVKIIRNSSIGGLAWDKAYTNDWANSSLKALLNGAYYNHTIDTENCYQYSTAVPGTCDFTAKGIRNEYQGMIENVTWYLGGGGKSGYTTYTPASVYGYERNSAAIYSGRSASTTGKIGLMYGSDYLYGVLATDCARTTDHAASCAGKDWLFGQGNEWTISPSSNTSYNVWLVYYNGGVTYFSANLGYAVRPVLYLSSSVYKVSGTGTITDPYIIGM